MSRYCMLCGLMISMAAAVPVFAGDIDPGLDALLDVTPADAQVSVLVFLSDRVDVDALNRSLESQRATRQVRHETVVRSLQQKAEATQAPLRDHLKRLQSEGRIEDFQAFWIANAFRVDGRASEIRQLAERADVGTIYFNYGIELIEPEVAASTAPATRAPEPGVTAVRAPEVWARGYIGREILVATLDTGVDGTHPAVASRWAGLRPEYDGHPEWALYDPVTGWTFPEDSGSHGTHTMGTVCGGAPGDEVGVAPGAHWIHAAVIDRVDLARTCSDAILAFQWLLDPDGDPGTVWDVPRVCSNSWGIGSWHDVPPYNAPCDPSFWSYLDACEAAGTVILFSAGNEGPTAETVRRPADRATDDFRTCAVGGINANEPDWPMYSSSSRGPTYCTPDSSAAIKPDITAPGEDVRSSVPGGGYDTYSGTSMASPHVNGVVALMLEACPDLTVQQVKEILYETANDKGDVGKDNDYGWGVVDAYEAVLAAEAACGPQPPRAYNGSHETPVDQALLIDLQAIDYDGQPQPMVYIITSLPGQTLTDAGNSHVITAGELPYTLSGNGNQVIYTPAGGYYGTDTFAFKANDGGTPPEGGDSSTATVSVLVLFDPPAISSTMLPNGCLGRYYGANYLRADHGQPELSWTVITDEYTEADLGSSQFAAVGTAMGWKDDDGSWSYSLPFTFSFFGQDYTSVWVCSNGFIDFASSDDPWLNSDADLIAGVRIAPLWDDLRTDRTGRDIYIESDAAHVTVRWDAVTYTGEYVVTCSVTLFADGTIQFDYGSGNTNLTPTIGLSGGDGSHYLLSSYNNSSSLTDANSLQFVLPAPLPAGVSISADGGLGGMPAEMGTFYPRFNVTDSLGRSDQVQLTLTILAECPYALGDVNCDGTVNGFDIDPFVAALADPLGYAEAHPECDRGNADLDQDGAVCNFDIDPFVALLVGP